MSPRQQTQVTVPQADESRAHRNIAVFAGLGLVVGLAWPILLGKQLGPNVPGNKKDDDAPAASASAAAKAPASVASGVALSKGVPAEGAAEGADAEPEPAKTKQSVTADGGTITACWHGKEKLDGERCGTLKLDKTVVPVLRQLGACPSAVGLTGELAVVLDLGFDKKDRKTSVQVRKGKKSAAPSSEGGDGKSAKSSELPTSTVSGVLSCVADYVRDLSLEKIPHEHDRYLVEFGLHFRANGDAPTVRSEEEAPTSEPTGDDVATIVNDSAILRDEPRTGKSVGRLVRGTRVKILGSRKDWYEVKMGNRQGWVYRAVIGR